MAEHWTLHEQREYAWEYFKAHAQQRMSLFNFFVLFSSLAPTALVSTFQKEIKAHYVGIALGVLLVLISCVFSKLDQRVRFLIKHSEKALKLVESRFNLSDISGEGCFRLFTAEEIQTEGQRGAPWYKPWQWHLTYSKCFGLAFWTFRVIGFVGVASSLYMMISHPLQPTPKQTARKMIASAPLLIH